ncbi:MAG: acyl carrier protein [Deltaproteobacteria bacterium]|nr:acyl carrier protein [Deltaproteobacteria bacterium]
MSALETEVTEVVAATIEESTGLTVELTPETALIDEGYLDSLTVLQLFAKLQDRFEVELDMDDLTEETFGTTRGIATLIDDRRG